jgi:NAD(P)H-dependent flavin oxidoreductase YrpB (nitropropane dioxygenase family)
MTFEQLDQAITRVQSRTTKPFGVNLRTDQDDIGKRVELLIARGVRVASFAQAPSREIIQQLRAAGIFTMPTIGARRHAEKMAEWGVDAVIAQGQEGGGHTGGVPTTLLVPQVVDAVSIPVVAAGGYFDGRGLVSALAYGAAGIAMGTRFLLTRESQVPEAIKAKYLKASVTDTVVTRAIDGYPQRVLMTAIVRALEGRSALRRWLAALAHAWHFSRLTQTSFLALVREGLALRARQELSYSQLLMAANAPMLTRASMVEGRIESGVLPTGQVVGVIETLPSVAELLAQIITQADAVLTRLGGVGGQSSTARGANARDDNDANARDDNDANARDDNDANARDDNDANARDDNDANARDDHDADASRVAASAIADANGNASADLAAELKEDAHERRTSAV